jgi:hypothetical protein
MPGRRRVDAVLFSGVVFKNVTWKKAQFVEQSVKIPIEPLYTQQLGPSSLRITYQLVLPQEVQPGTLRSLHTIFPDTSATLPRSLFSRRVNASSLAIATVEKGSQVLRVNTSSLDEAMENLGVSDSLLTIRPTSYRLSECKSPNLLESLDSPSFIDNNYVRQRFVSHAILDERGRKVIVDGNCTIWLSHLHTRSSVSFVPMEKEMMIGNYVNRQDILAQEVRDCFEMSGNSKRLLKCKQLRKNGPLEGMLVFESRRTGELEAAGANNAIYDLSYRYAPQIVNRPGATPPIELQTLPRNRPKAGAIGPLKADECTLPLLVPDKSGEFFDVNLNLRFGFLPLFRATNMDILSSTKEDNKTSEVISGSDDRDFFVHTTVDEMQYWNANSMLIGDQRYHKTRTGWQIIDFVFAITSNAIITILTWLYWYSRTGTEGLSLVAMKIALTGDLLDVVFNINKLRHGNGGFPVLFNIVDVASLFYFRMLLLLRIQVIAPAAGKGILHYKITRRPPSKRERLSRQLDSRFGSAIPIAFTLSYVALEHYISRKQFALKSGVGCQITQEAKKNSLQDLSFVQHIFLAAFMIQLAFNVYSPSPNKRGSSQRRPGSYAGSFKLTSWLTCLASWTQAINMQDILGHSTWRSPLLLQNAILLAISTVASIQSIVYPGVPVRTTSIEDEEEE